MELKVYPNLPLTAGKYYDISLYKDNKHIGYHNGQKLTGKITYYVKEYIDMFLPELAQVCEENNLQIKLIEFSKSKKDKAVYSFFK